MESGRKGDREKNPKRSARPRAAAPPARHLRPSSSGHGINGGMAQGSSSSGWRTAESSSPRSLKRARLAASTGARARREPRWTAPQVLAARERLRARLGDPGAHAELIVGIDGQLAELRQSLSRAFEKGGNTSLLLVGYRGCGKSLALDCALRSLVAARRDGGEGGAGDWGVDLVRLQGALHADDASALQDIARQLQPAEVQSSVGSRSFQENLRFLVDAARHGGISGRPLLFVLDDFEGFARGKQTLLYNLLDLTQSSAAAIVVVGLSSSLTVLESLEKRVRSRFSQQQIFFPHPSAADATELLRRALRLSEDAAAPAPTPVAAADPKTPMPPPPPSTAGTGTAPPTVLQHTGGPAEGASRYAAAFDAALEAALSSQTVQEAVSSAAAIGRPHRFFAGAAQLFAAQMDAVRPLPTQEMLRAAVAAGAPDEASQALCDCSAAELVILGAMSRLEHRGGEGYTFEAVWREYQSYLRLHPTAIERFPRRIALQAFQEMVQRGLVAQAQKYAAASSKELEARLLRLGIPPLTIVDAVESGAVGASTALQRWVSRWNQGI